jgi:hypothetical protein
MLLPTPRSLVAEKPSIFNMCDPTMVSAMAAAVVADDVACEVAIGTGLCALANSSNGDDGMDATRRAMVCW